jgi:hypothetical protein
LAYISDLGPTEKTIVKNAIRMGVEIPDRILNAPKLALGLSLYWNAFFDLDSERSHAFAPTTIPWSKIREYANLYEFDEEQTEDLIFLIRKMDKAHLEKMKDGQS